MAEQSRGNPARARWTADVRAVTARERDYFQKDRSLWAWPSLLRQRLDGPPCPRPSPRAPLQTPHLRARCLHRSCRHGPPPLPRSTRCASSSVVTRITFLAYAPARSSIACVTASSAKFRASPRRPERRPSAAPAKIPHRCALEMSRSRRATSRRRSSLGSRPATRRSSLVPRPAARRSSRAPRPAARLAPGVPPRRDASSLAGGAAMRPRRPRPPAGRVRDAASFSPPHPRRRSRATPPRVLADLARRQATCGTRHASVHRISAGGPAPPRSRRAPSRRAPRGRPSASGRPRAAGGSGRNTGSARPR